MLRVFLLCYLGYSEIFFFFFFDAFLSLFFYFLRININYLLTEHHCRYYNPSSEIQDPFLSTQAIPKVLIRPE